MQNGQRVLTIDHAAVAGRVIVAVAGRVAAVVVNHVTVTVVNRVTAYVNVSNKTILSHNIVWQSVF